ncbi:hypothetical protein ABH942_003300 [Flavobacterium sp. 28YEA47A]|uniref:hypothetical protein n=1 Tax=Flavobacterium sp. 28YEA47A TaxID=3156276 RepID=UPI0035197335
METKITFGMAERNLFQKPSFTEELISKKEELKKKMKDKNLQLRNLLKTNFELLKNNDINMMLF